MKIGLVLKPFPKGKMVLGRKNQVFPEENQKNLPKDVFSLRKPLGFRSKNQTCAQRGGGTKAHKLGASFAGAEEDGDGQYSFSLAAPPPRPGTRHHKHHRGPFSKKTSLLESCVQHENEPARPMPETPLAWGLARKPKAFWDSFWVVPPPPPAAAGRQS